VVWRTRTPGRSNASAVLLGDLVCTTFEPTGIVCLRERDGAFSWSRQLTVFDTLSDAELPRARDEAEEVQRLEAEQAQLGQQADKARRDARKSSSGKEAAERLKQLGERAALIQQRLTVLSRYRPPEPIDTIGYASATPVTDGQNLYAVFGTGLVGSFRPDGTLRWARIVAPSPGPMLGFDKGAAASPLVSGRLLIVPLGHLQALDTQTGATVWQGAPYKHFGTPALVSAGSAPAIASPDGFLVRAQDGKMLTEQ